MTPMGKLVFQVTGAFAEFERTMIRQRVKAGLKRALGQDVRLAWPKIDKATGRKIRRQLAKGMGGDAARAPLCGLRPFSGIGNVT
jgi:DNA invertase Pin-like site-specific DNA recombinase